MLPLFLARPDTPSDPVLVERVLSPTGVCVMIILAFVVDYLSVGPNSLRDRIAFIFALVALHDGFDGSPLDQWTVETLGGLIQQLLDMTDGAYIAGASVNAVIGCAVGILWIYTIGALLPEKTPRLGRFVAISFPTSAQYRINTKLWACALALSMLSDLPQGFIGTVTRGLFTIAAAIVGPIPEFLFGAA